MIEAAESEGRIEPGRTTIVEATAAWTSHIFSQRLRQVPGVYHHRDQQRRVRTRRDAGQLRAPRGVDPRFKSGSGAGSRSVPLTRRRAARSAPRCSRVRNASSMSACSLSWPGHQVAVQVLRDPDFQ